MCNQIKCSSLVTVVLCVPLSQSLIQFTLSGLTVYYFMAYILPCVFGSLKPKIYVSLVLSISRLI